jgi:hypothetical protein
MIPSGQRDGLSAPVGTAQGAGVTAATSQADAARWSSLSWQPPLAPRHEFFDESFQMLDANSCGGRPECLVSICSAGGAGRKAVLGQRKNR